MSNFVRSTRHPLTLEWDDEAMWIDDYFGERDYGVRFSDGEVFDPREYELETREVNLHEVDIQERTDVVVQVNALNVDGDDEATRKAKEVIERDVIPKLARTLVLAVVAYRHPVDGKFLYSAKITKMSEVRKFAERCVTAFIERFKLDATADDFMVVEYYKNADEVRITTLNEIRA